MIQAEVDHGLKDVKEQRDQLYRKLEMLKERGIEIIGPNMSVLKTGSGSAAEKMVMIVAFTNFDFCYENVSMQNAPELLYYSEDRPLGGEGSSKSQSASPTGTVNLGSGSTSSLR